MTAPVVRDIKDEGAESTRIAAMFQVHHTKKCIFAPLSPFTLGTTLVGAARALRIL